MVLRWGADQGDAIRIRARIEAKPEKAEEVAALLMGALPLAQAETGTIDW